MGELMNAKLQQAFKCEAMLGVWLGLKPSRSMQVMSDGPQKWAVFFWENAKVLGRAQGTSFFDALANALQGLQ